MRNTRYAIRNSVLGFSRQIFENAQASNFVKIRPVGAEILHADLQQTFIKYGPPAEL